MQGPTAAQTALLLPYLLVGFAALIVGMVGHAYHTRHKHPTFIVLSLMCMITGGFLIAAAFLGIFTSGMMSSLYVPHSAGIP
jgi:hypothetical protein